MAKLPDSIGPYAYQPVEQVAETRMSRLWMATELDSSRKKRQVVLKIARTDQPEYLARNQQAINDEARWLRMLKHPGIIQARPIVERSGKPQSIFNARATLPNAPWFLVTDLLHGGNLSQLIREQRQVNVRLALQVTAQIAHTLAYIHEKGIVHRDIKPANIVFRQKPSAEGLSEETQPILIDFGIARAVGAREFADGTTSWMALEYRRIKEQGLRAPVYPAVDIYALGLILYRSLAGVAYTNALDSDGAQEPPRALEKFPFEPSTLRWSSGVSQQNRIAATEEINHLISRATSDNPDARPTADEFRTLAEEALTHLTVVQRRWPRILLLVAAAILVVAATAYALVGRGPSGVDKQTSTPTMTVTTETADTGAPLPTSSPTTTATPVVGLTNTATPTTSPVATFTPTSRTAVIPSTVEVKTVSPTATRVPPPTPTPTNTPEPPPPTPLTPSISPTNTRRPNPSLRVTLLEPSNEFSTSGSVTFHWIADGDLPLNMCYEVQLRNPLGQPIGRRFGGFGVGGATRNNSVSDNLSKNSLVSAGEYEWAVLLVECSPNYREPDFAVISELRTIRYEAPSGRRPDS